jgi:hypothetical protein
VTGRLLEPIMLARTSINSLLRYPYCGIEIFGSS